LMMRASVFHGHWLVLVHFDELDSRLRPVHGYAVVPIVRAQPQVLRSTSRSRDNEPWSIGNVHGLSAMDVTCEDRVDAVGAK